MLFDKRFVLIFLIFSFSYCAVVTTAAPFFITNCIGARPLSPPARRPVCVTNKKEQTAGPALLGYSVSVGSPSVGSSAGASSHAASASGVSQASGSSS